MYCSLGLDQTEIGPRVVLDVTEYRFKTPLVTNSRSVLRWVVALDLPDMSQAVSKTPEEEEVALSEEAIERGAKTSQTTVSKKINRDELPCPSFREQNVCPYEIRRFFLAKRGRALMTLFPCPLACGDFVKKMDLKFHKRYLCRNRRVVCRFTQDCQMSYFAHSQKQHEDHECQRLDSRSEFLEAAELKNVLEHCELCAEKVRVRDMDDHIKDICSFRIIPCVYGDCKDPISANQLKHHLKFECRSKKLKRITLLVAKARKRLNYPRPWGIEMTLNDELETDRGGDGAGTEAPAVVNDKRSDDDVDNSNTSDAENDG